MSDWTDGYRAAVADLGRLLGTRSLLSQPVAQLLSDLEGDAFVIEHEQGNKIQRKRLRAQREAAQLEFPR